MILLYFTCILGLAGAEESSSVELLEELRESLRSMTVSMNLESELFLEWNNLVSFDEITPYYFELSITTFFHAVNNHGVIFFN